MNLARLVATELEFDHDLQTSVAYLTVDSLVQVRDTSATDRQTKTTDTCRQHIPHYAYVLRMRRAVINYSSQQTIYNTTEYSYNCGKNMQRQLKFATERKHSGYGKFIL